MKKVISYSNYNIVSFQIPYTEDLEFFSVQIRNNVLFQVITWYTKIKSDMKACVYMTI